jgi:3-methylcrotonyl-CoA carboxylase alpha subunit
LFRILNDEDFKEARVTTGFIEMRPELVLKKAVTDKNKLNALRYLKYEFERLNYRGRVRFGNGDAFAGFRLNNPAGPKTTIYLSSVAYEVPWDKYDLVSIQSGYMQGYGPVEFVDQRPILFQDGDPYEMSLEKRGAGQASIVDGTILAPMPGRVIAVEVSEGQAVSKGQKLLTLEAMKMEHTLTAPFDGVIAELNALAGAQVQVEALLVRVEEAAGS